VHRAAMLARRLGHQQPLGRVLQIIPLGRPARHCPLHVHAVQYSVDRACRNGFALGEQYGIRHGGLVVGAGVRGGHHLGIQSGHHLLVEVFQRRHSLRPVTRRFRRFLRRPSLFHRGLPWWVAV